MADPAAHSAPQLLFQPVREPVRSLSTSSGTVAGQNGASVPDPDGLCTRIAKALEGVDSGSGGDTPEAVFARLAGS